MVSGGTVIVGGDIGNVTGDTAMSGAGLDGNDSIDTGKVVA